MNRERHTTGCLNSSGNVQINPAVAAAQKRLNDDLAKLPGTTGFARLVLLAQIARDRAALAAAQAAAG